jgi:DNA-binding response OmpR family regulator
MFLTASNEEIHLKEAYKLGAEDYITKPFRKDELLGRIKTQLTLISQSRYISELEQEIEKLISLKS